MQTIQASRLSIISILCLSLLSNGCSRSFWREQADKDTYRAIIQAENDPRWVLPRTSIVPNVRSRFYDPYDPDCAPLPPDDPAAAAYMQCVDGMKGYESWHEFGQAMSIENPGWLSQFSLTPDNINPETGEWVGELPQILEMTLPEAIELSYINNRDYQLQLENLYLAALDLTFERFRYQVRYLDEPSLNVTGESRPGVSDSISMNSAFGVSQLLPTGGQWAAELANNTLWLFSGNNQTTSASLLSFSLVQPLLRNGGRRVGLESLTQAERDLLYQLRTLARFRKTLFTRTVSGGAGGGYLGLLTQLQSIRNQEYNIKQLERQVTELRALAEQPPGALDEELEKLPEGFAIPEELSEKLFYDRRAKRLIWFGNMTKPQAQMLMSLSDDEDYLRAASALAQLLRREANPLDVATLEADLANSRIGLQSRRVSYRNSLDSFKVGLGLPPDVYATIDDRLLEQFQLIDPDVTLAKEQAERFIDLTGELDPLEPNLQQTQQVLTRFQSLFDQTAVPVQQLVKADLDQVQQLLESQQAQSLDEEELLERQQTFQRDSQLYEIVQLNLAKLKSTLIDLQQQTSQKVEGELLSQIISITQELQVDLVKQIQSLEVIQVGLRADLISVNPFHLSLHDATQIALENRLDLMNQKAMVMDARRAMEVAANRLQAVVDFVAEGDVRTPAGGSNPVDFRGSSSSFRAGVQITAPLDQVAERNQYRATQIAYQRARRDYMELEDTVKTQIRSNWRNLKVLQQNLRLARQSLRISALSYDQAVEDASDPGQKAQSGLRGQNLIRALNNILQAQNNLIGIWADYEEARLNIYRDMDIMEVDSAGLWIDPFYQDALLRGSPQELPLLPPEPEQSHEQKASGQTELPKLPQALPPVANEPSLIQAISFEKPAASKRSGDGETVDADRYQRSRSGSDLRDLTGLVELFELTE